MLQRPEHNSCTPDSHLPIEAAPACSHIETC